MIDKKIYYCWFGKGPMSELDKTCIASWQKCCPDYKIIRIDESNYDWKSNPYAKQHYEAGNWSGVSNAARLDYFLRNNGFYLDTDVQLIRSLDELRVYDSGFITEFDSGQPDSGVLGRGDICPNIYSEAFERLVPGTVLHKEFIQILYRDYDVHGQAVKTFDDGFVVLGEEYFPSVRTQLVTKNTIGIHHFENTWTKTTPKVTDSFWPYILVNVTRCGKLIHKDEGAYVNMDVKTIMKKWHDQDMLGRLNYFFNPKVVKLFCKDFEAERIEYDKLATQHNTVTPSGMIVTWIE